MNTPKKIINSFKLAQPKKSYVIWYVIFTIIIAIIPVVQAYPTANVITSITASDYKMAAIWLSIDFALAFLYYYFCAWTYRVAFKQRKYVSEKTSNKINQKISHLSEEKLKSQSFQKLALILSSNVKYIAKFTDMIIDSFNYIVGALVSIAIVCFYNIYIGLSMLALFILIYFIVLFLCNISQRLTQKAFSQRDLIGDKLSEAIDGRKLTHALVNESKSKDEYLSLVKDVCNTYQKRGIATDIRKYITFAFAYGIITLLTIWLVDLTKTNTITLAAYLVIAPYLISIITYATNGFNFLYELQRTEVSRLRIETFLNMPEEDVIAYSNNNFDNLSSSLTFNNITVIDEKQENFGNLYGASFQLEPHEIALICGSKNSGKRALFYLLRRAIVPNSGTITMDGINIYDFDKNVYNHNFSYVQSTPYFYNETIMENLKYVGARKNDIISICKKLNIHEQILALPDGYDTNIIKNLEFFDKYLLFMIGLARAILSKSEWIAIYEYPQTVTSAQLKNIKNCLSKFTDTHSFVIFSANKQMQNICDKMFVIDNNKIVNVRMDNNG